MLSGIFFFEYLSDITVIEGVLFGIGIFLVIIGCFCISVTHIGQNEILLDEFIQEDATFMEQENGKAYDVLQM